MQNTSSRFARGAKLLASFEREAHGGWFEAEVVAQPTAPNHYLHSPVLEMSVGRVRPGGSASVSGKKPCPLSRLREDNDSVMRLIPDWCQCLNRRRVSPRARHQSHQYRYLDTCNPLGPFPLEENHHLDSPACSRVPTSGFRQG